jgi:rhodanese-related sulfurtransferase
MHKESNSNGHWAKRLATLLLLLLAATGCGSNQYLQELEIEESAIKLANETVSGSYPLVSTGDVKQLIDSNTPMLLVDAMPAESSYDSIHLPGAVNFEFPKEVIPTWDDTTMPGRTKADYEALLGEDKNRLIVVYCGFVKCARSHNAAMQAKELGYTNVKRYPGGLFAWRGAGHPTE